LSFFDQTLPTSLRSPPLFLSCVLGLNASLITWMTKVIIVVEATNPGRSFNADKGTSVLQIVGAAGP
jgi:hypothetical protein